VEPFRVFLAQRGEPIEGFAPETLRQNPNIMLDRFSGCGPNALDPNLMTPAERLTEIGEILAAGLIRLRARRKEAAECQCGESSVDFPGDQSVHG